MTRNNFIGRCDSCNVPIYDYNLHYLAIIGRKEFMLCPSCCQEVRPAYRPPRKAQKNKNDTKE